MATTTRIETRKRGLFGKLLLLIFWLFNGLMALWLFGGLSSTGEMMSAATSEAERAGTAIGATIGLGMVIGIWMCGAVILGLLVLLTPGKTIITETTKD